MRVSIPSRRVGDDFLRHWWQNKLEVSIPSRRVGDRKAVQYNKQGGRVSIPSRRVGDGVAVNYGVILFDCFHPLKAGRRPQVTSCCASVRLSFHPLKAGRRLDDFKLLPQSRIMFPSPQGGSETIRFASAIIVV